MKQDIKPEPLKAVKVFYIDPNWDLGWFNKSNELRKELFQMCVDGIEGVYGPEVTEVTFRASRLTARQQYQVGRILKKYLNLDMRYWLDTPASLTHTGEPIVAKTYEFPDCLCTKELTAFGEGFDVYPYDIKFRLDNHNKYSIRMGIKKEDL